MTGFWFQSQRREELSGKTARATAYVTVSREVDISRTTKDDMKIQWGHRVLKHPLNLMAMEGHKMTSPLGKLYREISLTQGQIAIVSPEDYERLNQFTWFAQWADHTQSFYAVRNARGSDGGRVFIRMHREILGLGRGDNRR